MSELHSLRVFIVSPVAGSLAEPDKGETHQALGVIPFFLCNEISHPERRVTDHLDSAMRTDQRGEFSPVLLLLPHDEMIVIITRHTSTEVLLSFSYNFRFGRSLLFLFCMFVAVIRGGHAEAMLENAREVAWSIASDHIRDLRDGVLS